MYWLSLLVAADGKVHVLEGQRFLAVSYTHLDVYKRQLLASLKAFMDSETVLFKILSFIFNPVVSQMYMSVPSKV